MTFAGAAQRKPANWKPLDPAERAEAIRVLRRNITDLGLTRTDGLRSLARCALLLTPAAATAYLALRTSAPWAWLLHVAIGTAVLCTLPAAYHEAAHRNVSRSRVVNDGVGTLAAALHGVPFGTWRYFHLAHHANTGTADDSEVYSTAWSRWSLITFPVTQWAFLVILWRWTLATARGGGPRWIRSSRQRRAATANAVASVGIWAAELVGCVLSPRLVPLLVVPCALSVMIAALTLVPEHFPAYRIGPGDPDQLDRTGTFRSNPLLRLILWNSNFHAAHHFAPKVPAHRLRQLDTVVGAVQDPAWRWPGYYRWYRDRLRELSWQPVDLTTAATRPAADAPSAVIHTPTEET